MQSSNTGTPTPAGPEWIKFYTSWRALLTTTPPEKVVAALLAIIDYANGGRVLPDWVPVMDTQTGMPIDVETKMLVLAFKPGADAAIKRTATCRNNARSGK